MAIYQLELVVNGIIHSINGIFLVLIIGISGHNCRLYVPSPLEAEWLRHAEWMETHEASDGRWQRFLAQAAWDEDMV